MCSTDSSLTCLDVTLQRQLCSCKRLNLSQHYSTPTSQSTLDNHRHAPWRTQKPSAHVCSTSQNYKSFRTLLWTFTGVFEIWLRLWKASKPVSKLWTVMNTTSNSQTEWRFWNGQRIYFGVEVLEILRPRSSGSSDLRRSSTSTQSCENSHLNCEC